MSRFQGPTAAETLDAAGRSDTGLLRPANEDSFLCEPPVLAVADGLGGHPAGDVASALALEPLAQLASQAQQAVGAPASEALAEAVRRGNDRVHANAQEHPERLGMGTTVTAALVGEHTVQLAHVGDSRAYRWRPEDGLTRLTRDHTPTEEAVAAGALSPEEAAQRPERHVLLRVVGTDPEVAVDVPEPATLASGEMLLLCSDGLTEPVEEPVIAEILASATSAADGATALLQAALDRGGPDNVTVVLARRR